MNEAIDYDGAWKEAIEGYLQPFLALCFPDAAAGIDWGTPVEFLDKELQEIVRDADLGKQRVDKLIKVRRRDGEEEWVLLHLEVQAQLDESLPLRLYQYHHRIVDRFGRRAATLALLADERQGWKPACYEDELWGCRVRFDYPVCKLLELAGETLERETVKKNPAAVVVAAHLATQSTGGDMDLRQQIKWRLTRRLYELQYGKKDILNLYRLIDWLMVLPKELEMEFRQEVINYEKENTMPYVTSIERFGREEGRQEGRQEEGTRLLRRQLQRRFGDLPVWAEKRLAEATLDDLEQWSDRVLDAVILEDIFA